MGTGSPLLARVRLRATSFFCWPNLPKARAIPAARDPAPVKFGWPACFTNRAAQNPRKMAERWRRWKQCSARLVRSVCALLAPEAWQGVQAT
jgi:hypothetical protein